MDARHRAWVLSGKLRSMEPSRWLELLAIEGDRLGSVPVDSLDTPVPTLPDWTVERVLRHTGKVHRWVTATLAAGPGAGLATDVEALPKGPAALDAYRESVLAVAEELARHDPNEESTTFVGPGTAAFWYRRQAHEVVVHRVDAQDAVHAAGGPAPDPIAVDHAADATDEWARLFLATRFGQRAGGLPEDLHGRSVHIHGTDDPGPTDGAEWILRLGADGVEVEASHAKGDVALRGPAEDLLLVLWRRRPLTDVEVVGEVTVAERLIAVARF